MDMAKKVPALETNSSHGGPLQQAILSADTPTLSFYTKSLDLGFGW